MVNRVTEIRDSSPLDQWSHVEGTLNPADIRTRGKSVRELEASEWFTRPEWLRETEGAWPQTSPQLFHQKQMTLNKPLKSYRKKRTKIGRSSVPSKERHEFLPIAFGSNQNHRNRKNSNDRRIEASNPNTTAEKPDG